MTSLMVGAGVEARKNHGVRGHRVQVGLVSGPQLTGDLSLGPGNVGNAAFYCDHSIGVEAADVADYYLCVGVLGKSNC